MFGYFFIHLVNNFCLHCKKKGVDKLNTLIYLLKIASATPLKKNKRTAYCG